MIKSDYCWHDLHELCDGCCLDSPMGCECRCHEVVEKCPHGVVQALCPLCPLHGEDDGNA